MKQRFMYVTNAGDDNVTVIDGATNTVVGTPIPVGAVHRDIAFNPNNGFMYVTNARDVQTVIRNQRRYKHRCGHPHTGGDSPS